MVEFTIVDDSYNTSAAVIARLLADGKFSEAQALQDLLRRTFVVGAASFFEQFLKDTLLNFVAQRSDKDEAMTALVKVSLIDRGFHQMFQWEGKNANKFLSHFGNDLGAIMKAECSGPLKLAVQAFMELGDLRNSIVHQNFHKFYFEKTLEEAYGLYREAKAFVDYVEQSLLRLNEMPAALKEGVEG